MEYVLHLLVLICVYTALSQSLSLVAGYIGQISLAHAGFFGIGGYTTAILSINYNFSFLINLPFAIIISGAIALLFARVAVKTINDYFIIITLGIQVMVFSVLNNWQSLTNGPFGIAGIPPIQIIGLEITSNSSFAILTVFCCALIWSFLFLVTNSPFGRILRAISEDEIFVASLGKNVDHYKVISFTISGIIAAIPGALYAHYISYIDPSSFTIEESIFILSIVIIGGKRNLTGIFLAAAFLVLLPEALRFIGVPSSIAANVRQIIYGLALVLIMFRYRKNKIPKVSPQNIES